MKFREISISKLHAFALAGVFALVLAGCGGGGGTAADDDMDMVTPDPPTCTGGQVLNDAMDACVDPEPTDADKIATAQGRASTAATNARGYADAAEALDHQDDDDVKAAVDAAKAAATAAETLRDLADRATDPTAAKALADQAETAKDTASTALGNAMRASTAAQTAIDMAAMTAATTKAAETKATQIATEAAVAAADDNGLGGDDAPDTTDGSEGEYTLAIKHGETSITVEGATDADDEKFMQAMDFMDGRTMHTRTMDADDDGNVMTEVVIVSTDIEAPKAVEFAKFENADGTTPQALDVSTDTTNDTPTPTNEALAVDETSATVLALVKSASFAAGSGASTQHTFDFDDASTTDMDEASEVAGTYNGADGTYRCNGTSDCTVTVDDEGAVTAMSDDWVFTPDMGATSNQPDYDYLHYGFWLKRTADKDGVTTYNEVETFAGSSIAASGNIPGTVTGSASYSGGAVGVYVHRTFAEDGETNATSGHFTAEVNLTATFNQTTEQDIAPNMLNRLTGTIDNFELSEGEANRWSVAIESSATSTDGTHSGTAKGGAVGDDGSFNATFHGPTTDDAKPHSVVGEFNAGFVNGNVAGAFGARIDD